MKLAKLIYNPAAGDGNFKTKLDQMCQRMQSNGWQIVPYRTASREDISRGLADLQQRDYQAVFASGGDGTINLVINQLQKLQSQVPLAIYPGGTANDLAAHLGMPRDVDRWCEIVGSGSVKEMDLGLVNGSYYFHNVVSAGLLTDVSYEVDNQLKNLLGKMAYYIKGIEKIPKFRPFHLKVTSSQGRDFVGEIMLCLVMNGNSAGGFQQLVPGADSSDGLLDVLLVKSCSLGELLTLFIKLRQGEHLHSDKVEYFRCTGLELTCPEPLISDMDGEKGPGFPLEIQVKEKAIKVFTGRL